MSSLSDTATKGSNGKAFSIVNQIGEFEKSAYDLVSMPRSKTLKKASTNPKQKSIGKNKNPNDSGILTELHFVQLILVVKNNESSILPAWEEELYQFLKTYVKRKGHCLICVDGTSDHIHLLLSLVGSFNLVELVKELKEASARFINSNYMHDAFTDLNSEYPTQTKKDVEFDWFKGFGHHNYHHSMVYNEIGKIKNQKALHQLQDFKQEYHALLKANAMKHQLDA